ncbi:MAG: hypothetical protein AB7P49_19180 [Bdellovibrionales bacterium]
MKNNPFSDTDFLNEITKTLIRPIISKFNLKKRFPLELENDLLSTLWMRSRNLKHYENVKGWAAKTIYQEIKKALSTNRRKFPILIPNDELEQKCSTSGTPLEILIHNEQLQILTNVRMKNGRKKRRPQTSPLPFHLDSTSNTKNLTLLYPMAM